VAPIGTCMDRRAIGATPLSSPRVEPTPFLPHLQSLPAKSKFLAVKAGRENCVHEHQIGQRTGCAEALFASKVPLSHFFSFPHFPLAGPLLTRHCPIPPLPDLNNNVLRDTTQKANS
jgi:hypothetical protein